MTVRRADDNQYVLLSNGSATGSAVAIKGGQYMFQADGTVGGSTVSLQIQLPNNTWVNVTSLGANVEVKSTALPYACSPIELPAGQARGALTGGPPSALYAYLVGLG